MECWLHKELLDWHHWLSWDAKEMLAFMKSLVPSFCFWQYQELNILIDHLTECLNITSQHTFLKHLFKNASINWQERKKYLVSGFWTQRRKLNTESNFHLEGLCELQLWILQFHRGLGSQDKALTQPEGESNMRTPSIIDLGLKGYILTVNVIRSNLPKDWKAKVIACFKPWC